MRPIPAIAAITIREAWASRIYLAIAPFIAFAAFGAFSPQPSPEDAARYTREVIVAAALICVIPVIVLFMAMSLREERLDRSLSVLLARPVRRFEYVIGRYLGFCATGALLLLAMCITGTAIAEIALPGKLLSIRPRYSATKVSATETAGTVSSGIYIIEGPEDRVTWEFTGVGTRGPDTFEIVIRPEIYGETHADADVEIKTRVWSEKKVIGLEDNRDSVLRIAPPAGAARNISCCSVTLSLRDAADFAIGIDINPDSLGRERYGLQRLGPPEIFFWSYAKTLAFHFINIALVAAIVVLVAGFASAPVAGGFALVAYIVGISTGGLQAFLANPQAECAHCHAGHVHIAESPFPGWFAVAATAVLNFAVAVFPDLGRFEATGAFTHGETMPLVLILHHLAMVLPYIAGLLAAAWFILARSEVTE